MTNPRSILGTMFLVACWPLAGVAPCQQKGPPPAVDLTGEQYESVAQARGENTPDEESENRWAAQWFERVRVGGYGAFAYLHTESGGTRPQGALLINQASLFIEADVQEDFSLVFEVMSDRFGIANDDLVRIQETYAEKRHALDWGEDGHLDLRVGRFDIPFGQLYHYQDAPENPLVSYPVALPYNVDEGVMVFGEFRGVEFKGAFLDGSFDRQSSGGLSKSGVLTVSGEPCTDLHLSASFLYNGETAASALCFSGIVLTPVGVGGGSALGNSASTGVSANVYGADARYRFGERGYLHLSAGHARIDDADDTFDRDFTWFVVEPSVVLSTGLRATARFSEVGTYDGNAGYRFEGRPYGNGIATYGYDTKRLSRLAVGLAWEVDSAVLLKAESGFDRFEAIDASAVPTDHRVFVGAELVVSF